MEVFIFIIIGLAIVVGLIVNAKFGG